MFSRIDLEDVLSLWVGCAAQQVGMWRIEFFIPTGRNVRLFVHIAAGTIPTCAAIITYALHVGGLALSHSQCVDEWVKEREKTNTHTQKWKDSTGFPEEARRFNDTLEYRVIFLNLWFLLFGVIICAGAAILGGVSKVRHCCRAKGSISLLLRSRCNIYLFFRLAKASYIETDLRQLFKMKLLLRLTRNTVVCIVLKAEFRLVSWCHTVWKARQSHRGFHKSAPRNPSATPLTLA